MIAFARDGHRSHRHNSSRSNKRHSTSSGYSSDLSPTSTKGRRSLLLKPETTQNYHHDRQLSWRETIRSKYNRIKAMFPKLFVCGAAQKMAEGHSFGKQSSARPLINYTATRLTEMDDPLCKLRRNVYKRKLERMVKERNRSLNKQDITELDILCDLEVNSYFYPSEVTDLDAYRQASFCHSPRNRNAFIRSTMC